MCGICGIVSPGRPVDPDELAAMTAALTHRGPDSSGSFVSGSVGLGMRRLSIIDLERGDQPIANEDGSVQVVQNGEIYNYRELRRDLERRGHRFSTASDTEVLVHLYEDEGPAFVEHLRGMFAVAVWDSRERRLVLARDQFGIKPLYYRLEDGALSFASELKSLLAQRDFPRDIDLDALEAFLAFNWIPAPLSIFRAARKLPPAHVLVWREGDLALSPYQRPTPPPAAHRSSATEEELEEELLRLLRDSVRAHLVADVPVGVLLSGGVDSCALAALASQLSSKPVATFTIGFEERAFNEVDLARLVAERYGTDHHDLILRPDAAQLLFKVVEAFDEPFGDSSALPAYMVSELAAGQVKVAFSGEGGDELFGGYRTYAADMVPARIGSLASALRPVAERIPALPLAGRFPDRAKRFTRAAALPPVERHASWTEVFSPEARSELIARDRRGRDDPVDFYRQRYAESEGADRLARFQDVDIGLYLADDLLVKTDRASMAHSLEARVPFLDPALARFALGLPRKLKVRGLAKKRILRRAVGPLLPEQITKGPKRGFSIPAADWLRGDLEPLAREVLSPDALRAQGYFDPAAVSSLLDAHTSGRHDLSRQLWGLLCFSLWFERYARAPEPLGAGAAS